MIRLCRFLCSLRLAKLTPSLSQKLVPLKTIVPFLVRVFALCALIRPGASLLSALSAIPEPPIPEKIEFNRDVRPILSENCFKCHGFDKKHREADRRLDTREGALAENDGVKAIVPGNLAKSEAAVRIHSKDKDEVMPPPNSGKKITPRQQSIIDRWIQQGAEYQGHWSYLKPSRSALAPGKNPVDTLVQTRLAELGLRPSPEADRRTLIRRLSMDLIGLPPSPEETEAFIADTHPGAYEKLVEKLLNSPHYGERMAIPWLDAVRFADSIGYHSDNPRNVWPYRDYVIKAFNENKRFDQFTIEQIAGDLMPNSTQEQKVASAYNRLLLSTEEGGAQPKDYEARMLTDRVRAIGTVWLGQTIACAQCHDHKFDPIAAKDFYSLGAFFADIEEPIVGPREIGMPAPNAEQQAKLKELESAIGTLEARASAPEIVATQSRWEAALASELKTQGAWTALHPVEAKSNNDAKIAIEKAEMILVAGGNDKPDVYRVTVKLTMPTIKAFRLEALTDTRLPASGPGRGAKGAFSLSEFSVQPKSGDTVEPTLAFVSALVPRTQKGLTPQAAIDANTDKANGWKVSGGLDQAIYFYLKQPLTANNAAGEQTLVFTISHAAGDNYALGKFRLSASAETLVPPNRFVLPETVAVLKVPVPERTPQQLVEIRDHYRRLDPTSIGLRGELEAARSARANYEKESPHCLVSQSKADPRTVRILPRGDFMNETGEVVKPALPHYLPQPASQGDKRLTRLDLAQWLVSKENPLTARVYVNRLWKQYFGIGLSKVLEDLGTQGEEPRNGALLDWLAVEFMESGWDVKNVVRLMVTSHTYRQVSTAPKALELMDPYNREMARQGRWRLDAELVRDNALQIAGLLSPKMGGPSVKPYQPDAYWENLNFPQRVYDPDKLENQYRRGLYTWWQRSATHPSMLAFDAPSREECTAERTRSNIPQQALTLLNDPTYVEAARVFAGRILGTSTGSTAEKLTWACRQALGRAPGPEEIQALSELLQSNLGVYKKDTNSAQALLKVGFTPVPAGIDAAELAAWTNVARVILNLHETITRS